MPNELSEKVYPDGTVVKLRDDTAREQISDINDKVRGEFKTQYTDFNDFPHGSIVQVPGQLAHVPGPTGHYYIVFTYFIAGTTTFKTQLAIENADGNIYTRDCQNGTWGNWNKFAKT